MLQAACNSFATLGVLRVLAGAAEACSDPSFLLVTQMVSLLCAMVKQRLARQFTDATLSGTPAANNLSELDCGIRPMDSASLSVVYLDMQSVISKAHWHHGDMNSSSSVLYAAYGAL